MQRLSYPKLGEPGWWWVQHSAMKRTMEPEVTEEVAREAMKAAGLLRGWTRGATHTDNPVTSYSGGWRMKTQLTVAKPLRR